MRLLLLLLAVHPFPNVGRGWFRGSQHELDGAKRHQSGLSQAVFRGQSGRLADIAQQQVGLADLLGWTRKGRRNGFFDQAFLEPDAQVAGNDFDQVFGFQRGAARKRSLEHWGFGQRSARSLELLEKLTDLLEGKGGRYLDV